MRHFSEPTPIPEPEKEPEKEPMSEPTGSEQVTDLPQSVASEGAVTSETDLEDHPFECKICKRRFKTTPPRRNSKEWIKEYDK